MYYDVRHPGAAGARVRAPSLHAARQEYDVFFRRLSCVLRVVFVCSDWPMRLYIGRQLVGR